MTSIPSGIADSPTIPALHLLGGIAFRGLPDETANALLAQSKVVGLLAYLALSPAGAFQRRDRIVGLLWPDLDQPHARGALRKAVHFARSALGESTITSRGDEELSLKGGSMTCDVTELRAAIDRGLLAHAVELYRADLMPGFHLADCKEFDEWLEEQRATLREATVAACWALAQNLEAANNGTLATKYAKKVTRLDKTNERLLRRAMQMLDRLGDRAGALAVYDEFTRHLRNDFDADPSPETVKMAESLRAGRPIS